jgi:protein MON2
MLPSSNSTRLVIMGLGGIQKLISHRLLDSAVLPRVLTVMATQVHATNETVQLKVLQATVALLTTASTEQASSAVLPQALGLCFQLHRSRSSVVCHPASATLRQVISMIFEHASAEYTHRSLSDSDSHALPDSAQRPYARVAYYLLQDICALASGDRPCWLPVAELDLLFALELIESVQNAHFGLFLSAVPFRMLLKDRVCPLVVRQLKVATEFSCVLRVHRLLKVFIQRFHFVLVAECEVFLVRLIRSLQERRQVGLCWCSWLCVVGDGGGVCCGWWLYLLVFVSLFCSFVGNRFFFL